MHKETDVRRAEHETLAKEIAKTFITRRDLYARQLGDGSYVCVQKPLRTGHLVAHLKGELTLGAYVLNAESKTRYIVFDADDDEHFANLVVMADRLATQGATAYLELSRRGGHLWLFFSIPTRGKVARELGKGLSMVYGLDGIELFPKQDRLKSGPGSLVRLPFGVHRKSGHCYGFINLDGKPLAATTEEQVHILSQPKTVPASIFRAYRSLLPTSSTKDESPEFERT